MPLHKLNSALYYHAIKWIILGIDRAEWYKIQLAHISSISPSLTIQKCMTTHWSTI